MSGPGVLKRNAVHAAGAAEVKVETPPAAKQPEAGSGEQPSSPASPPPAGQGASASPACAPGEANAVVVGANDGRIVIEVTCRCGTKTYLECEVEPS
jgi:hypothetical protein